MKRILLPLSAICLLLLLPTSYATCYFPNGKTDSNYRQCPGSLSCCAAGEACLSNGYCFTANFGILYRGLCADKTWPLSDCPRACYEEIPDGWANMFQCNASTSVLTCSQQVSAEGACKPENALNTYEWTPGNVTAAQIGVTNYGTVTTTTSNATDSTTTSSGNSTIVTQIISETCSTPTCSSSASVSNKKSDLIALGAGLGAGLGIPLLISTILMIHCANARQRERKEQKVPLVPDSRSYRWTGTPYKPAELRSSAMKPELMGSLDGRLELPGS